MPNETSFTVTQTALSALMTAVQSHLNNTQNILKPMSALAAVDGQLVSAWQAFEKSLAPVAEPTPDTSPVKGSAPAADA